MVCGLADGCSHSEVCPMGAIHDESKMCHFDFKCRHNDITARCVEFVEVVDEKEIIKRAFPIT